MHFSQIMNIETAMLLFVFLVRRILHLNENTKKQVLSKPELTICIHGDQPVDFATLQLTKKTYLGLLTPANATPSNIIYNTNLPLSN